MIADHATHAGLAVAAKRLAGADAAERLRLAGRALEQIGRAKELRFFIDGTRNLGHQSGTLNLAQVVAERSGFHGLCTFVFADYRRPLLGDIRAKIALLTDGWEQALSPVRWMELGEAAALPSCRFGFSGGADDLTVDYNAGLGVAWFVRLQPFLWDDQAEQKGDPYYTSSRIEGVGGKQLYLCDADPQFRQLRLPRAVKSRPPAGIPGTSRMRQILPAAQRDGRLTWPIYGLQHFGERARPIMETIILAAQALHDRRGVGVRILSFCPGDGHVPTQAWMESHGSKVEFRQIGPIASSIYREVLASSELPPVVEGQQSVSELIAAQRPFLQIRRTERVEGFEMVDMAGRSALAERLDQLSRDLLRRDLDVKTQAELAGKLLDWALLCLDRAPAVLCLFETLGREYRPDKLDVALAALALCLDAPSPHQHS